MNFLLLTILLCITGCAYHDYGDRQMPKQLSGESSDHYWQRLKKGHWF